MTGGLSRPALGAALAVGCSLLLGGCASMGSAPERQQVAQRARDYPVAVIPASYAPAIELPLQLRGKGGGALLGAGHGVLSCLEGATRGSGGGDPAFTGLAALFCVTLGSLVGGVAGAVTTEPAATATAAHQRLGQLISGSDPQRLLAQTVTDYLQESGGAVARVPDDVAGPASPVDSPGYAVRALSGFGSVLELRVVEIAFDGTGREGAPLCLRMRVAARMIDARTAAVLDELPLVHNLGCLVLAQWLDPSSDRVAPLLAEGYRRMAEELVDELYLVYRAPPLQDAAAASASPVPPYVLAPLQPPPPEVYLDIDLFRSRRDEQGFGGMHFRDVDTLSPVFRWETFPRAAELAAEGADAFSDVSYDWRLYEGVLALMVRPGGLVHAEQGLGEARYVYTGTLKPCSWYFWSVRARFRLHGAWRTTEWAGAYNTAGGHYSPSSSRRNYGSTFGFVWPASHLLYPFRTPPAPGAPDCWDE